MADLTLHPEAQKRWTPFFEEITESGAEEIDSIHITGSALTDDYDPRQSDINSLFILKEMNLRFLKKIAPLGKKYGKKGICAPLLMTHEYICRSLDVFPLEFLNIRKVHLTVSGKDPFEEIEIKTSDLRRQCEREIKVRMIGLRQGFLAASGNRKALAEVFVQSFSGYIPLFRGILVLFGKEAPLENAAILSHLQEVSGVNTGVFRTVYRMKKEGTKLDTEQLSVLFEDYHRNLERLGKIVDELEA